MKFLADEGVDEPIVAALRKSGFDVEYILEMERGISDDVILEKANQNGRILITQDKDFGELVFRLKMIHTGVILLRFHGLTKDTKVKLVLEALEKPNIVIEDSFVVIQPGALRIRGRED